MNLKNKVNIHNRFDIEIRDSKTGELKKSITSFNIVLNQMYTRLCGGSSYFVNIHFGSGNGTLAATRTTLFSHLGTKAAVDEEIIKAIPLSTWKRKVVLNPEEFVGNTISEVGIAFGATNTNLVTHSLLKDSEGNPISIVKTDVDVITIYATVFVTFDESNPNLKYISMPSSNTLVNYLIGGGVAPTGAFSVNDMFLGSVRLGATSVVTWTSDVPNKKRNSNVSRFATTVGNGHVKYLEFANVFSLKLPSSPIFSGQSYVGVSLGVGDGIKTKFMLPSSNVRQDSISIKLNGVVSTNFIKSVLPHLFTTRGYLDSSPVMAGTPACDISLDGLTCVFGSQTMLLVYKMVGGNFALFQTIAISSINNSVAISGDGSTIAVSSASYSKVQTYRWNGTQYALTSGVSSSPSGNGLICKLSSNGLVLAFTHATSSPGYAVYDWNGSSWVIRPVVPSPSNTDGIYGIDINSDGSVLSYGQYNAPFASVYDWNGVSWTRRASYDVALSGTTSRISLSSNGNVVSFLVGSTSVSVYDWNGVSWTRRASITDLPINLTNLLLSNNGNTLYVGSGNTASKLYVYDWNGVSWVRRISSFRDENVSYIRVSSNELYGVMGVTNYPAIYSALEFTFINFNTPPAISDVITADYIVDGVHKTDQFVIDASFAIQFGEGI